nr:MAG TPA_asm: hypothetical protein [Caudoviricetes sp.]
MIYTFFCSQFPKDIHDNHLKNIICEKTSHSKIK